MIIRILDLAYRAHGKTCCIHECNSGSTIFCDTNWNFVCVAYCMVSVRHSP